MRNDAIDERINQLAAESGLRSVDRLAARRRLLPPVRAG